MLPTGGKAIINYDWRLLYIYPGQSDFANTEGLCGYLSDNREDDFRSRGSSEVTDSDTFAESFR